jgi:hypothetical protein
MAEAHPIGGNGSITAALAAGATVQRGQTRVDPHYPELTIHIDEPVGSRWKVTYGGGGWALLAVADILAAYPVVIDPPEAG